MQEFTQPSQNFDKSLGLDKELEIRGIYLKTKVIKLVASSTGDKTVACGFPPKLVLASCRDSLESCSGSSDFETSFSIRNYDNSGTFSTGDYTELVNLSTLTGDVANRLQNGFIFTISSFSGGSKNIYFTCFQ